MRYLSALILILSQMGCASRFRLPADLTTGKPVSYRTPDIIGADDQQKTLILAALAKMPAVMSDPIRKIRLDQDLAHFKSSGRVIMPIGHRCPDNPRVICVRSPHLSMQLIWHEATHIYAYHLSEYLKNDGAYKFYKIWGEVAGDVYHEDAKVPESEGVLTDYGRTNIGEDIAEWVEECYYYLYISKTYSSISTNPHFKKDVRYQKKLKMLHEHGFLTESQYNHLEPLFK